MNVSETEGGSGGLPEPADGHGGPILPAVVVAVPGIRTAVVAIVVALASGLIAWGLAETLRVAEVVQYTGKFGGAELSLARATRNGATAYAILGALLGLGLGMTAGLFTGHRSISRTMLAGISGAVLGACGGTASSYALFPPYFGNMETADLTLSMLIHLGIWTSVGAAAGLAFGIGSGHRDVLIRSLVGGIVGAAMGALLFDVSGALIPMARTERPLPDLAGTRLAANMLLGICVAVGIVTVASQKPRVAPAKA